MTKCSGARLGHSAAVRAFLIHLAGDPGDLRYLAA